MSNYTPEEDAFLVEHWAAHTCSEISHMMVDRFGVKRSRCSIISRVHRKLELPPKVQHWSKGHRPGKRPGPGVMDKTAAKAAVIAAITLPWVPGCKDGEGKRYVRVGAPA